MNFELTQYLYNSADFSVQLQTMEHSRPPVRVILAWKNRDEKIEARKGRHNTTVDWGRGINLVWNSVAGADRGIFLLCLLLFEDKVKSSE